MLRNVIPLIGKFFYVARRLTSSSSTRICGRSMGFHGAPDIERLHTLFCRSILGVKKSTNIAALYSELGRKPLIVFRKLRILKYWWKIIESGDTLIKNVYSLLYDDVLNERNYNASNWAYRVKIYLSRRFCIHME